MRSGTQLAREIQQTHWSTAGNLSNRSSGVQIPRDICTRFGRCVYSTKSSWIIITYYPTSYLCSSLFSAVPLPPTNVQVSDCKDWTAKLSWVPDPSDNTPITHYLIEQESSENPVVFVSLLTVTNPNTTNAFLKLSKGSVPRFRMKAVNRVGASRPSLTVETSCKSNETKVGKCTYFTKRQIE